MCIQRIWITFKEIYEKILSLQDGRINYDEFAAMMNKGNLEVNTKKRRDSSLF